MANGVYNDGCFLKFKTRLSPLYYFLFVFFFFSIVCCGVNVLIFNFVSGAICLRTGFSGFEGRCCLTLKLKGFCFWLFSFVLLHLQFLTRYETGLPHVNID